MGRMCQPTPVIAERTSVTPWNGNIAFRISSCGSQRGRQPPLFSCIDKFSGWPAVTLFPDKNTTARRLNNSFRLFFMDTRAGSPVKIYSDDSPFGAANLQSFLRQWGVAFGSSSPHNHKWQPNRNSQTSIFPTRIGCVIRISPPTIINPAAGRKQL
jgi:hypothetical protein